VLLHTSVSANTLPGE